MLKIKAFSAFPAKGVFYFRARAHGVMSALEIENCIIWSIVLVHRRDGALA
jgi:hypothetical protein